MDEKDRAVSAPEVIEVDRFPPFIDLSRHQYDSTDGFPIHVAGPSSTQSNHGSALHYAVYHDLHSIGQPDRKIMGLRRRTFWIVLSIMIITVLAAAIGGGVGGALANSRSEKSDDISSLSSTASSASSSTLNLAPDSRSTPEVSQTASATLPRITGLSLRLYSERNFAGKNRVFDTVGLFQVYFPPEHDDVPVVVPDTFGNGSVNITMANSYIWLPPDSTRYGCAVRFCSNNTSLGWRGTSCTENPATSRGVQKVFMECGPPGVEPADVCEGVGTPISD